MLDTTTPKDETAGAPAVPAAPSVHPGAESAIAALFDAPLPGWKPPAPAVSSRAVAPAALATGSPVAPAIVKGRLKGIAIVGSQPTTVMQAPFGDEGWAIYACSPDNTPWGHEKNRRTLPRFDQWFELHAPIEDHSRPYGYLQYVASLPFVWMRDGRALATGLFKGARPFPDRELYGTHGTQKRIIKGPGGLMREVEVPIPAGDGRFCPYMFTSSLAYMMAKAIVDIEEMVKDGRMGGNGAPPMMGAWGIRQQEQGEYAYQRPGTRYFLWEAMMAGIKVHVDLQSGLFDAPDARW